MKTVFTIKLSLTKIAIADLIQYNDGFLLTRINVPSSHRNQGIGSKLLSEIIQEADKEKVNLYLTIEPSGDLNFDQLESWYKKYGFEQFSCRGFMMRKVKTS